MLKKTQTNSLGYFTVWSKSKCHSVNFYSVFRPNDTVDEGTEASLPNSRDISSEPFRRELIANLAEHILFSKCYSITVSYLFCFADCMKYLVLLVMSCFPIPSIQVIISWLQMLSWQFSILCLSPSSSKFYKLFFLIKYKLFILFC